MGGGNETQAKDLCLRLLTDRARSRAELARCLAKQGFATDVSERALDRLTEVGLVDDAGFAQQWVHSRHVHSGKGKRALAGELRRKGIAPHDAAEALAQIGSDDERARAVELVRKKMRTLPLAFGDRFQRSAERDRTVRKLVGMLARRGYPQGLAFEVVKTELDQVGADTEGLFEE